jgi:hypothetical protein
MGGQGLTAGPPPCPVYPNRFVMLDCPGGYRESFRSGGGLRGLRGGLRAYGGRDGMSAVGMLLALATFRTISLRKLLMRSSCAC